MHVRKGWAAFIALVILFILSSSSAVAGDGGGVVGCFNQNNAALLARFGPADPAVRSAFDLGGCLAMSPNIQASSPVNAGPTWQLQLLGSSVPFYAPAWGAPIGNRGPEASQLQVFSAFAPQSAHLLEAGRMYVWCDVAEEDFARRWRNFRQRWDRYRAEGGRILGDTVTVVRRHFTEHGPRLVHEADALQAEHDVLERRCAPYHDLVLDERFVGFLRSIPKQ